MSRPIRVLTIGHSYVVAANRALIRNVARDPDFEIVVVGPSFFHGDLRSLAIEPEPVGSPLKLVSIDARLTRHVHVFQYNDSQLRRLLREGDFDVVHAWEEPYIYAGYQIARALKGQRAGYCFRTAQNLNKWYPPPFAQFENACVARAEAWIAGATLVHKTMLQRGYPAERGRVLSLAVDTEAFRPLGEDARAAVRRELGMSTPIIGFVGRLSRDKGLSVLMRALEQLPESLGWNLLLLGSGELQAKIKSWAKSRGWRDRVFIKLTKHGDVPGYMGAMDLMVVPSQTTWHWREQFGRVVIEAFAAGVPVIASDSGEIPVVVGDAGQIVPERDVARWAEAIRDLISQPERRAELARKGLGRAQQYSTRELAPHYGDLYRWLNEQAALPQPKPRLVAAGEPCNARRGSLTPHGRRRILSIAHSYCVALNRRLADEMAKVGREKWEVTAVAPSFFHGDLRPIWLEVGNQEQCKLESVPVYGSGFVHLMWYGRPLRELLRQQWTLVHCWEEPYIVAGAQTARLTPPATPLVYYSFQNILKHYPPPFNFVESYSIRRAAGWIAAGRTVAETLVLRPGYSDRPRAIIPLGVDVEVFRRDMAARVATRERFGWDGDVPVVGFVGRFVPEKGLRILTQALEAQRGPWRALFVGGGPLENWLRGWACRQSGRAVVLTGVPHDGVAAHLNAMDILCCPSQTTRRWREQFGRMLIEAFACGVPVVASDSGEIPFVVGEAGMIVTEHDLPAWTAAIERLLGDPEQRRRLSEHALDRAHSRFSWNVIARQNLEFFESILASRGR